MSVFCAVITGKLVNRCPDGIASPSRAVYSICRKSIFFRNPKPSAVPVKNIYPSKIKFRLFLGNKFICCEPYIFIIKHQIADGDQGALFKKLSVLYYYRNPRQNYFLYFFFYNICERRLPSRTIQDYRRRAKLSKVICFVSPFIVLS